MPQHEPKLHFAEHELFDASRDGDLSRVETLLSPSATVRATQGAGGRPHLASFLQEGGKSANIHAGSAVIRGIPAKGISDLHFYTDEDGVPPTHYTKIATF